MPTTGQNYAGSGTATPPSGSGGAWSNPGNITSNNSAVASVNHVGGTTSGHLVASQFGFSVSASTIDGIIVRIEAQYLNPFATFDQTVSLQLRNASGTLVGTAKQLSIPDQTETVYTFGSSTDKWGTSLTQSDITDTDFGVEIWTDGAEDYTIGIDYVTVEVYYTTGTTPVTGNVDLNASATGTVSGVRGAVGESSSSASASITPAVVLPVLAYAQPSASATTNTDTVALVFGYVDQSGSASTQTSAVVPRLGYAEPSASATQTTNPSVTRTVESSSDASASQTTDPARVAIGSVADTANATLDVTGVIAKTAQISASSSATATDDILAIRTAEVDLDSTATDYVSGVRAATAEVSLDSNATMTGSTAIVDVGQVALTSDAQATTDNVVLRTVTSSSSSTATATVEGTRIAIARFIANARATQLFRATVAQNATIVASANSTVNTGVSIRVGGVVNESGSAQTSTTTNSIVGGESQNTGEAVTIANGSLVGQINGSLNSVQQNNGSTSQGETCEIGVVVLRNQTLTGSGTFQCRAATTVWAGLQPSTEPCPYPIRTLSSSGSIAVPFGTFFWESKVQGVPSDPTVNDPINFQVGCRLFVSTVFGSQTVEYLNNFTASSSGTNPQYGDATESGTWDVSLDCELCMEPNEGGATGTGASFTPDPPHNSSVKIYYRTKVGGNYTYTGTVHGQTATVSGTITTRVQLPVPDAVVLSANVIGDISCSHPAVTATVYSRGTWRGAQIGENRAVSSLHGDATANNSTGTTATLKLIPVFPPGAEFSNDNGSASSYMRIAVPLSYGLQAKRMAMENDFPDSDDDYYYRANELVLVPPFTSVFSDSRTLRSEQSEVKIQTGVPLATESVATYYVPNQFGQIYMSESGYGGMDQYYLIKDRRMPALSVTIPALTADLTGTDTAITGDPYGVQRSYTLNTPNWRGLMGYRYLQIEIAESGTNAAGQPITIKVERDGPDAPQTKTWTKERDGTPISTPGGGHFRTIIIDMCAPDPASFGDADPTDSTYPHLQDWQADGGNEDSYPRKNEGAWTGLLYASRIKIECDVNRTFTINHIKAKREDTPVRFTNLPAHTPWVKQRPDSVVSESGTTTEHLVRQCFEIDHDGRLLVAEWSDAEWSKTTGGVSEVVTNSLFQHDIKWLCDRINAQRLIPGWTANVDAPELGSSGLSCFYNRTRRMVSILGSGLWWESPSGPFPQGRWRSGIDIDGYADAGGAIGIPWQGGYDRLLMCPGNVGDVFQHINSDTEGALILRLGHIRRMQGVGMLLDQAGQPVQNKKLTMEQDYLLVTLNKGSGTTNVRGYAQTGLSYGDTAIEDVTLTFEGGSAFTYASARRKRLHFRSRVVVVGDDYICMYRHPHDRACLYFRRPGTGLVCWDYLLQPNNPESDKIQTIIDESPDARMPTAWYRPEGFNEVVFLRGTQIIHGRSTQFVRSWTLTTIPGTASAVSACNSMGRLVVALYRANRWYCRVGKMDSSSGVYTFSNEQPILDENAAKPIGHLSVRNDNVIEFAYINNSDQPRVVRCHSLSTTGQGKWA